MADGQGVRGVVRAAARLRRVPLWLDDPWYDPQRDPVSRMLEIRRGDQDVTEGDQLTLDVRRDCEREYLRRASAFIRAKSGQGVPFSFISIIRLCTCR